MQKYCVTVSRRSSLESTPPFIELYLHNFIHMVFQYQTMLCSCQVDCLWDTSDLSKLVQRGNVLSLDVLAFHSKVQMSTSVVPWSISTMRDRYIYFYTYKILYLIFDVVVVEPVSHAGNILCKFKKIDSPLQFKCLHSPAGYASVWRLCRSLQNPTITLLTFNVFSRHNDLVGVVLLVDIKLTAIAAQLLQNTSDLLFGVFLQGDPNKTVLETFLFQHVNRSQRICPL